MTEAGATPGQLRPAAWTRADHEAAVAAGAPALSGLAEGTSVLQGEQIEVVTTELENN